jgi:hypothetical protein
MGEAGLRMVCGFWIVLLIGCSLLTCTKLAEVRDASLMSSRITQVGKFLNGRHH